MDKKTIINKLKRVNSKEQFVELINSIMSDECSVSGGKTCQFKVSDINQFLNTNNPHRYKTFTIPKKSGGTRQISAPAPKLKKLLYYIKILLEAFYNPMQCVQGFTEGRSIASNANMHLYQNYVFNIDLSDFFPSITQARIYTRLKFPPYNFPEEICRIIAGLSCVKYTDESGRSYNGLPQGAPTSPILSNIICEQMDRRLTGLAKRCELHYSRYADDMTFSSMRNVYKEGHEKKFIDELRRIIIQQGFKFNEKKTRLQKIGSHQEVTGLTIGTKINVSRNYIKELRSVLHVWEKFGYAEAYAWFYSRYKAYKGHSKKGEPVLENVINGKLNYLKMIKGSYDSTYKTLSKRFDNLNSVLMEKHPRHGTRHVIVSYSISDFMRQFKNVIMDFKPTQNGYVSGKLISENVVTPIYFDKIFRESSIEDKSKILAAIQDGSSDWYISEIEDLDKKKKYSFNHFWQISRYQPKITTAKIADNTIERLLEVWENKGIDAAIDQWKSIQQTKSERNEKTKVMSNIPLESLSDTDYTTTTTVTPGEEEEEFPNNIIPKDLSEEDCFILDTVTLDDEGDISSENLLDNGYKTLGTL